MSDKTLSFNIVVDGVSDSELLFERIGVQVKNLKKEITELEKAAKKGIASDEQLRQLAALRKEYDSQIAVQKNLKKEIDNVDGSVNKMRADLSKLKAEYYSTADEGLKQRLIPQINALHSQVSKAEQAVGVHQRNVGNYPNIMGQANAAFKGFGDSIKNSMANLISAGGIIAGVTIALKALKDAFTSTVQGMNLMSTASQIYKQAMYDFVTTMKIDIQNLADVVAIQKELNKIRQGDLIDLVKIQDMESDLIDLRIKATDATLTQSQVVSINKDIIAKESELIRYKVADLQEELLAIERLLKKRPEDYNLQKEYATKLAQLRQAQSDQSVRLHQREQNEIEKEQKQRVSYYENLKAWLSDIEKAQEEKAEAEFERKQKEEKEIENARIKADKEFADMKAENEKNIPEAVEGYEIKSLEILRKYTGLSIEEVQRRTEAIEAVEQSHADAKVSIAAATTNLLAGIAGESEELQKISLIADRAFAIAQIILQTKKANAALRFWGAAGGPVGYGIAQAAIIKNNIAAGIDIAAIIASTALAMYEQGGRIRGGVPIHIPGSKDNLLIAANKSEAVINDVQIARLGGTPAMRRAGIPGFAEGGAIGNMPYINPSVPASSGDISNLSDRIARIEVYLPVHKIMDAVSEYQVIIEPQRI